MNESFSENFERLPIQYVRKLNGHLSCESLVDEAIQIYEECLHNPVAEKRSETLFLKTIISWEEIGKCTIEDLSILLGWYFGNKNDFSWKKAEKLFSQKQKDLLRLPEWISQGNPFSSYTNNGYAPARSAFHEWIDNEK
jgi:hypothetical protein